MKTETLARYISIFALIYFFLRIVTSFCQIEITGFDILEKSFTVPLFIFVFFAALYYLVQVRKGKKDFKTMFVLGLNLCSVNLAIISYLLFS